MAKLLTAAAVERLRPEKDRREIPDGGCAGLYLIVQPSGVKSWALRYHKPGGRTAKVTLGRVDLTNTESEGELKIGMPLTLGQARRLATELQRDRARGKDVAAGIRRERLERDSLRARTFDQAARHFVEQHLMRSVRRWEERARMLGIQKGKAGLELIPKGLANRWRDRPIAEITGDDVHSIIDECREKGVPGLKRRSEELTESQALRMFSTLSKMFSWLVERRRIGASPVVGVARPSASKARDRVLMADEIVKFWKAAEEERGEFAAALKLLLLTGQRLAEVSGMRREELSDDLSSWTIPSGRTKNKRVHVVPLAPMAREIVRALPPRDGLVFTTDSRTPMTIGSKIKNRLDQSMKVPHWRVHDLRRTAATHMAEIGIAPHVVEAVLNHVSGAKASVAGIYNRAQYAAEKKTALERWAAHVDGLVSGRKAKVLKLPGKAS